MKQHWLVSPNLSGRRLLVRRSRDCSHRVSHCLRKSHLRHNMYSIKLKKDANSTQHTPICPSPPIPIIPTLFPPLFTPQLHSGEYLVISCKFKWWPDHEALANMMIEIPRNTHIVIPAQKTGPAASKGYPAGTWQFFKWTKKKRFQENLDNELLVDSLRSTVATVGPPAVCFQVAVLYLGRRTYQVCYWGFLTSDFQMFSTYFQQH